MTDRPPYTKKPSSDKREGGGYPKRPYGDKGGKPSFAARTPRPYAPRTEGNFPPSSERKPYSPSARPSGPRSGAPYTPRFGAARPYSPRSEGARPYSPRGARDGETRSYSPRPTNDRGDRPYTPRPQGAGGGYQSRPPFQRGPSERSFGGSRHADDKAPYRPRTNTPPTGWGHVANWYDDHLSKGNTYHETVVLPNVLRLVDPKAGDVILDVPCGQGYFARAFAEKGAEVIAVDIGAELVARASREQIKGVRFFVSPSDKLPMLPDGTANKAVIILGIQNIKNVEGTLAEVARTLRPDGELHIVMNHPAFRVPKQSAWGWDPETHRQFRRVDTYLSESEEKIDMQPGKTAEGERPVETISFHRPFQWYFKTLGKQGFAVDRLEEWISDRKSNSGPRAVEENRIRKEIPLFCYMRVKKI